MTRGREEFEHQAALFFWAGMQECVHPELALLHASAAGEKRDVVTAAKLKRMGVKPGWPDAHLPVKRGGYMALWIEMKSAAGRLSPAQQSIKARLEAEGARYLVCRSWTEARDGILHYLTGE